MKANERRESEMQEIRLLKGSHPERFASDGTATMCAQEFASYLAGEPHSDHPRCVSPVLNSFMVSWNDGLDDETRQKLRPYIVRTLGTAGDGQDRARSYMALDWFIRVHTPGFLVAAGLTEEAAKLRGLAAIADIEKVQAATPHVNAAWDAARAAARDAAWDAARAAARAATGDAARAAARAAARDAAWAAAGDAAWTAAGEAARDAAWTAAGEAARDALASAVALLQESAFELLDRMIDPTGLHDVPSEHLLLAEANERSGALVS